MMVHGKNRIGKNLSSTGSITYITTDPTKNEALEGTFFCATVDEVNLAMQKAKDAFIAYRKVPAFKRAAFLEAIAEEIMALGDALVRRASVETALSPERIESERTRTMLQLRLYADHIKEGSWVNASIDLGDPDRKPNPKPDLRRMYLPIGPVVVFTASNFPLAYSTAGGDTASALAAGNPVIVKSHPSHAGTNEMVADAIAKAAERTGMPDGVFSSLNDNSFSVGEQLVKHPDTKAVGFTGSYNGGMALWRLANEREVPIPVFSEMGSTNPVYLLEDALHQNDAQLAKTMAASITLGAGQFCTNPGLMVGIESNALKSFAAVLEEEFQKVIPSVMLSAGIAGNYFSKLEMALQQKGVTLLTQRSVRSDRTENSGMPGVATVPFKIFKTNPLLHEEIFGPFSLLVICENIDEMKEFAALQKGQLTTSVFGSEKDFSRTGDLINKLLDKAGRLIFNGVPTGVEVTTSIQHGGPYPATTDSRFTSVGPDAILRFVRPVAFQNAPESILPDELKDGNPLGIWRKFNGKLGKD
ncbi:aldehyde dehydrogenase (NADP(+)) [Saccharicrinis sp. FJH2]|uniref:aldehyde dehydrogenase (NADP(+)) n=1 Tax=Saccharicrinis sp. FJH65 TaxID=3344659 RepID=UPI0035F2FBF8